MYLSKYFLHTLRETPSEAQISSHRLMLRAGMINQTTAGIYSWLPLGLRVLQKIEAIIAEEQNRIGCHRVLMPTLQPASLWQESGRYEAYGKEMLRLKDRHDREMVYGPTHEEVITDIVRQYLKSYQSLPQILYQISWKFRDEIRPRYGVMRGREFLMKDGYSFDLDFEGAKASYEKIFESYLLTFRRLGLRAIPVQAQSGAIGGTLSHEFQVVAPTGESMIYYDEAYDQLSPQDMKFSTLQTIYAATDEKHDPFNCPVTAENIKTSRGIEVGHIFYFGTKYSKAMGLKLHGPNEEVIIPEMGSYGIGVSRLVGAIIESSHDENGIIWPPSVAPFAVGLINTRVGDSALDSVCTTLYEELTKRGIEVLYDDRCERSGSKFADMDLIGLPWQIIVGNKTLQHHTVEVKNRKTGERQDLTPDQCLTYLSQVLG